MKITVYNSLGQNIATLVNQELKRGSYEVNFDATNLPSGVYFYSISATGGAGDFVDSKKMIVLK